MKTMKNERNTTTIDTTTGYRLLWSFTLKNQNQKVVTQDVFPTIEEAKKAVYSVIEDMSSEYRNVKHSGLMLLDEPQIQDDGIEYVAHIEGKFFGGSFYIRIITCDEEPDAETITATEIQGRFMELVVDGLGEFKFLFKENIPDDESQGKYYMEVLWNPSGYGLVDFIVGQYVDDIDSAMQEIKEDMSYYIDGARISCICRIESGHDDEGVYEGILNEFFDEEYELDEEIDYCTLDRLHLISPYKLLFKTGDVLYASDKLKHCEYKYYFNSEEIKSHQAEELLESLPFFAEITPDNDIRCGFCGKVLFKYTGQDLSDSCIEECTCESSKIDAFAI